MIRFFMLLPRVHCGCSLRTLKILKFFLLVGAENLVDFGLHAGVSDDQFGQHICFPISHTFDLLFIYGSERETVTPPDGMGVLILGDSGYTRQDERDGLEQGTGLAGVSGIPTRNR